MRSANKINKGLVMGEFDVGQEPVFPKQVDLFPSTKVSPEIELVKSKFQDQLSNCKTKLEVLDLSVDYLAECAAMAADAYRRDSSPDNAYQLAALTNAHKSALSQLEKMKDPRQILEEIESKIENMFVTVVRSMTIEMLNVKNQLINMHPEDLSTIEDLFKRMMNSIQPETQRIYDDLEGQLKKILGIKG